MRFPVINWPIVPRKEYDNVVYKLECLLCHATGNRYSKAGYSLTDMERMVDDYEEELIDEAIEDYKHSERLDKEENLLRCYGYSAEDLIRFGILVRNLGIEEHEIKRFLYDASGIWNLLQERFEKELQHSFESALSIKLDKDESADKPMWPKNNPIFMTEKRSTNTMKLKVKLDENAIQPTRAHTCDAGLDLYAPVDTWVYHDSIACVDTGVHVAIPEGYVGLITSKSGDISMKSVKLDTTADIPGASRRSFAMLAKEDVSTEATRLLSL